MKHNTPNKIHTYIIKNGLFIRIDPINNLYIKIKASRLVSHILDLGYVNVLDAAKENVQETLFLSNYGDRWACTKEEFHGKDVQRAYY